MAAKQSNIFDKISENCNIISVEHAIEKDQYDDDWGIKNYVFYHSSCIDGIASKFAAWKKFKDNAIYRPILYHQNPLDFHIPSSVTSVYFLDFSVSLKIVKELRKRFKTVMIIDHHESSYIKYLEELHEMYRKEVSYRYVVAFRFFKRMYEHLDFFKKNVHDLLNIPEMIFDMEHSGAYLSWKYFHPKSEVPNSIESVEDYDLHTFRKQDTLNFIHGISCYDIERMEFWNSISKDGYSIESKEIMESILTTEDIIKTGAIINKYIDNSIKELMESSFKWKMVRIVGYEVAILNINNNRNETSSYFLKHTSANAVLMYYLLPDGRAKLSIRSLKGTNIALAIAKVYKGGGHPSSCGATLSIKDTLIFLENLRICSDCRM